MSITFAQKPWNFDIFFVFSPSLFFVLLKKRYRFKKHLNSIWSANSIDVFVIHLDSTFTYRFCAYEKKAFKNPKKNQRIELKQLIQLARKKRAKWCVQHLNLTQRIINNVWVNRVLNGVIVKCLHKKKSRRIRSHLAMTLFITVCLSLCICSTFTIDASRNICASLTIDRHKECLVSFYTQIQVFLPQKMNMKKMSFTNCMSFYLVDLKRNTQQVWAICVS